jgi:hypothetical protein
VYPLLILLFRVLPAEDLALIKQVGQRALERLRSRNPQPASS